MTLDLCRFLSLRLNKLFIFLVCHKMIDMNRQSVREFSLFFKTLADNDNNNDNDDDNSIRVMQRKHNPV